MQLVGGSIHIGGVGPFLIGGSRYIPAPKGNALRRIVVKGPASYQNVRNTINHLFEKHLALPQNANIIDKSVR